MPPTLFISYRREDTQFAAGRLYDRLVQQFGSHAVFMDVAAIELGTDFAARIDAAIGKCNVLLVMIGSKWLTAADANGGRRLDHPDDLVRLEVLSGLGRDVRVIPILVDGTRMPSPSELPPALEALSRRNAMTLEHATFQADVARLVEAIASADERSRWIPRALWGAQIALSVVFAYHGVLRLLYGPAELAQDWGISYAARQTPALLRFVGVAQLVAALLMAVPVFSRRWPKLVAAAAGGLCLSMALGLIDHLIHAELGLMPTSILFAAMTGFVAWGRFVHRG